MIGARARIPALAACAAGLALGSAASAQAPDTAAPPAVVSEELPAATAPPPTPVDTPTHRPTRPPLPTATNSLPPADTETPTAPAPSTTPTRPPLPTTTATSPSRPTATPFVASLGPPPPSRPPWGLSGLADGGPLLVGVGGVIAILAAWLGARLAGLRARADRRRARRTLATAMLLELRRIDAVLRRVVGLESPTSFPSLDHPIMEAALHDLTLFETVTAARIAQFHGALRGIQHEIGEYRDNPLRWAGRLSELNQLIKSRAAAACRAVPELMRALEREGGAPPPHLAESPPTGSTDKRDLPPPPFGAGEGDDWTF